MKIICGLGNPGREYERNRHNVGFLVVDQLADKLRTRFTSHKWEADLAQTRIGDDVVLLIKPMTFMNASGQSLGAAARFYKVPAADVLVVHDELDLPFGKLALKAGGGTGGHNGLNSIRESWGEDAYARLRFGIGKPTGPNAKQLVVGHVLGDFVRDEEAALPEYLGKAAQGCQWWAEVGMQAAMNKFNRK